MRAPACTSGERQIPSLFHPDDNPLIRKLESVFTLGDDERQALENLPMQLAALKDHQDIVREGDQPSRSCSGANGIRLLTPDRWGLGGCPVGGKPLGDLWQALCFDFQAEV
jgi:hypothetical protein